jgi:hypothetical protein
MPASAIDRFPANRRNEFMERISRNARRLRGSLNIAGSPILTHVGRNDAMEALLTRLGTIPVISLNSVTSLTGNIQAFPADRPAASETVSVAGPTAAAVFAPGGPMVASAFTAAGAGTVLTATSSVDAAAKGRATVDVPA